MKQNTKKLLDGSMGILPQRLMVADRDHFMASAVLVNLTPPNPYSAAALAIWRQGSFLNFNGATRLTASLWPFITLPYLMLLGRRNTA